MTWMAECLHQHKDVGREEYKFLPGLSVVLLRKNLNDLVFFQKDLNDA